MDDSDPVADRQRLIDQCKGQKSPEDIVYCKGFAERAVKNATIFESRQCDPNQPPTGRFSKDFVEHFAWCMWQGNAPFRDGEDQARIQAVEACKVDHPQKDCRSCHSNSANKTSPQSGGISLAAMPVDDHTLFSNLSAAVQAVLGSGGGFDKSYSPKTPEPTLKKRPSSGGAVALPSSSGAYLSKSNAGSPSGSSAIDRLGGPASLSGVAGNSGGVATGGRPIPCASCGTKGGAVSTAPAGPRETLKKSAPRDIPRTPDVDYGGGGYRPPPGSGDPR
jgi:hypothetical protein